MLREPSRRPGRQRRGVILVLILGMLALMALIGVSFATFSGQTQRAARMFSEKFLRANPQDLVDYALSQLINDTDNPMSAIRGHSLKRDMYGNDAQFNGYLELNPATNGPISITGTTTDAVADTIIITTDLPNAAAASYNYNFTRWTIRTFPKANTATPWQLPQTFEVLEDLGWNNTAGMRTSAGFVQLRILGASFLSPPSVPTGVNPLGVLDPVQLAPGTSAANTQAIVLDGRYRRAFNGPGISTLDGSVPNYLRDLSNPASIAVDLAGRHPNFRYNGIAPNPPAGFTWYNQTAGTKGALGDPGLIGVDEDYDAPDLENWFLALQSADGQVVIPSFHRPSILYRDPTDETNANTSDWRRFPLQNYLNNAVAPPVEAFKVWSKFLRPRGIDHSWGIPDPVPDPASGKIEFDVDNDGDGFREGVWLDLGYAPQADSNTGRLYKPLFSFTVVGLNGRIPLNTAGNIQGRRLTSGSDGFAGDPTWSHTSHLGYSVNEINPLFALQATYNPAASGFNIYGIDREGNQNLLSNILVPSGYYSQTDNRNISVGITQLRNLLSGNRPHTTPIKPANPVAGPTFATSAFWGSEFPDNTEKDFVNVGLSGQAYFMPNGLPDATSDVSNEVMSVSGGNQAVRNTEPVAGRWGEAYGVPSQLPYADATVVPPYVLWNNRVRAGLSVPPNPAFPFVDGTDDDRTTYDASGELAGDNYDATGSNLVPAERIRRYVTPIDLAGVGRMIARDWDGYLQQSPLSTPLNASKLTLQGQWGTGQDVYGRIGYFMYFRPPGIPLPFSTVLSAGGLTGDYLPNITSNPTHGYDGYRSPSGALAGIPVNHLDVRRFMAAMPLDPAWVLGGPTYWGDVNSRPNLPSGIYTSSGPAGFAGQYNTQLIENGHLFGSLGKDDAAEMNLYASSSYDQPFNHRDLDWLYNRDPDISQDPSRLAQLAPISLDASTTGLTPAVFDSKERRRLFTTEVWDLNRFSFAPDNPTNAFPLNSHQPIAVAPAVSRYWENGGLVNQVPMVPRFYTYPAGYGAAAAPLAHGDRRINLNFPLPISNDPLEPVRQKWIFDTYQMLKEILPPGATDTPQELAQLSQFVINIVDFRDPDGTITIFDNKDLVPIAATATNPASVDVAPNPAANTTPLRQYGMEYLPVAINEVLAFSYKRRNATDTVTDGLSTQRLFIELVNTLTQADGPVGHPSCNIDLKNWDLLVHSDNDDWRRRPDPINGFVEPVVAGGQEFSLKFDSSLTGTPTPFQAEAIDTNEPIDPVRAIQEDPTTAGQDVAHPRYFYTLANDAPTPAEVESNVPPVTPRDRPNVRIPQTFVQTTLDEPGTLAIGQARWCWVYLRRLANQFMPFNAATNPYVVVDSMRFPYIEGSSTDPSNYSLAKDVWSASRHQPFMGGQVIYDHSKPDEDPANPRQYNPEVPRPRYAYGYEEQTRPPQASGDIGGNYHGNWGPMTGPTPYRPITKSINHTIGLPNESASNQPWRHFVFHDRDFTGIGELLLVPGCSPGLFSKQFVDLMYRPDRSIVAGDPDFYEPARYRATPDLVLSAARSAGGSGAGTGPAAHPYLPEQFYYTGASPVPVDTAGTTVASLEFVTGSTPPYWAQNGGVTGGGWHKMFEFFEVPSSMFGAIGPAYQGENFDWFRQDRVPGKLNLNLIIDEEVFFGLVDDPRLNREPIADTIAPRIVTEIAPNYIPTSYLYNRGYMTVLPTGNPADPWAVNVAMKASFSDFLKLRHGGSGFLYAFGTGAVGQNGLGYTTPEPIAAERPYRSFAFPDINYTLMRPAGLPSSDVTTPPSTLSLSGSVPKYLPVTAPALAPPLGGYSGDPGVRNPYLEWGASPVTGPDILPLSPVPPRRLFQIPDYFSDNEPEITRNAASERGNSDVNVGINHSLVGRVTLSHPYSNLFFTPNAQDFPAGYNDTATPGNESYPPFPPIDAVMGDPDPDNSIDPRTTTHLGGTIVVRNGNAYNGYDPDYDPYGPDVEDPTPGNNLPDLRRHPLYRTEMLQKVMNLTTVRTHQFAVWITVGFFEVTKAGNTATLEPDSLGPELLGSNGRTQRYRSFFVIDRTRATGFNPANPGDYNDLVVYRRRIE